MKFILGFAALLFGLYVLRYVRPQFVVALCFAVIALDLFG